MHQYQVSNPVQQPLSGCHLSMCEPWAQLCFIDVNHREHLFTKICRPKHAQNFCSKGCHFGVAWKKILIECVQARQGKLGLQIWITLQVNYFQLQVNGRIRGVYCEWRAKDLKIRLKLAKNLKSLLEPLQQLCYLIFLLIQVTIQSRGTHTF